MPGSPLPRLQRPRGRSCPRPWPRSPSPGPPGHTVRSHSGLEKHSLACLGMSCHWYDTKEIQQYVWDTTVQTVSKLFASFITAGSHQPRLSPLEASLNPVWSGNFWFGKTARQICLLWRILPCARLQCVSQVTGAVADGCQLQFWSAHYWQYYNYYGDTASTSAHIYNACKTHRIKLILSLHVSLDEEDVVDRLLDDERQPTWLWFLRARDKFLEAAEDGVKMVFQLPVQLCYEGD